MQVAAADAVSVDVPVAGGVAAMAQAAGLAAPPDRARFVAEIARVLYNSADSHRASTGLFAGLQAAVADAAGGASIPDSANAFDIVPVPLTPAIWSSAVFHRDVPASALVAAILADRRAALLCHGLAALDDPTLAFFAEHQPLITFLYSTHASAFASFADAIHVRGDRVVTPGGDAAAPLWEAAAGAEVTHADRFVHGLFERGGGRLAYLYDAIGQLDAPHAAFAVGSWLPPARRAERFARLVASNDGAYREWQIENVPFARPIHDVASMLTRVRVSADGAPTAPSSRALWEAIFADDSTNADARAAANANDEPFDAAWLAEAISRRREPLERGERLDQLSFGQRVFAAHRDADRADEAIALRSFVRYPMLMLTLERVGITTPAVFIAAASHASKLTAVSRRRRFVALAQFQGTLALIARFVRVRSMDAAAAQALITSLCAVPVGGDGYSGALLQWIARDLDPKIAAADGTEGGLIERLAGVDRQRTSAPIHVQWEGQSYHLDLGAAEERRLRLVRGKQHVVPLDVALDVERQARALSAARLEAGVLASAIDALRRDAAVIDEHQVGEEAIVPDGEAASRHPRAAIEAAIADLAAAQKSPAAGGVAPIGESLVSLADAIAADALLSLAYAVDLGDPDGTALLAGNVARRHDFGIALEAAAGMRARLAWTVPRQDVSPGTPWHVIGSALGLDVALASLTLRRVDAGRIGTAPTLTSNERQTFAASVSLMNPDELNDADRDAIAAAVERGRARIAALTSGTVDPLADEIALDGWRRRAVKWSLAHDAERVGTMFSLTEMLSLGGGSSGASFDAWGMAAFVTTGCLCTRLQEPGGWWALTGRPQLGLLATAAADLNLRVAIVLRDLHLPAAIARDVLTAAMQDYVDEVRPSDHDDWLTLVRTAQALPSDRVEDYVAAITAGGALVPDEKGDGSQ